MTSDLDSEQESPVEPRRRRAFRVRLWSATGGYLIASAALDLWGRESLLVRSILAIVSVAMVALIVLIVIRRVRQLDEYQRKLFFPGLAVGFTVAIFAAITLGTLNSVGVAVPDAGWPIAILGILAWEATNLLVRAPLA